MARNCIQLFGGKIIGYIDEDPQGNKIATNAAGKILGRYNKAQNKTLLFGGSIIANGDVASGLILLDAKGVSI